MAKQKTNVIALELEKFDKKITEFQTYLDTRDINDLYEDTKAKEIDTQLKLMNAIPYLLEQLKKLREEEANKKVETYGGKAMGGLATDFLHNS